jgi:hypothetical protein
MPLAPCEHVLESLKSPAGSGGEPLVRQHRGELESARGLAGWEVGVTLSPPVAGLAKK